VSWSSFGLTYSLEEVFAWIDVDVGSMLVTAT
jgi:hypothetical protein